MQDCARRGGARLGGRLGPLPPSPRELPARDNCPTVLAKVNVPFLLVVPSGTSISTRQLRVCVTPRSDGASRDFGLAASRSSASSGPSSSDSSCCVSNARLISDSDAMVNNL